MEASNKPRLSVNERQEERPMWTGGRGVSLDAVSPEGVARLNVMLNLVLPRLTKS